MLARINQAMLAILVASAVLAGCDREKAPGLPEPTRYGEFDLAPRVLFRRSGDEVAAYLDQFKKLGESRAGGSGRKLVQVRDQDRILTATLTQTVCDEVHVSGRLGDSIFPKTPADFAKLRDAYGGAELYWTLLNESLERGPEGEAMGGHQLWRSRDGTAIAEASWVLDRPAGRHGDYELNVRNAARG